uniref:HAT C-terminal dimerisation domain-containing protein n=1 Tax=Cyprinus carpio TaxID=7962 RepID=A0A8C2CWB9_CYPCA
MELLSILLMMLNDVAAFEAKLDLFAQQLQEGNFTHFPVRLSQVTEPASFSPSIYCAYLRAQKDYFSSPFTDIKYLKPVLAFTGNPFAFPGMRDDGKWSRNQSSLIFRGRFPLVVVRRRQYGNLLCNTYPALIHCAVKILTCFGSTYLCESAFSAMGIIKSKKRSLLTDRHLTDCLRAATSEQQPDLKLLVKRMQTQISH